jgi:plastocyanin
VTRRALMLSLSIVCCWSLLSVPAVAGGGGCHQAPRPFDARTQVVAMEDYCYSPSVVRINPGQSITWVNRDFDAHTVTGVAGAWGEYAELGREARVTNSFAEPGVYPYFCAFHPGMVGAVVVGNGVATGSVDQSVEGTAVSSGETESDGKTGPGRAPSSGTRGVSWLWAAPVVLAAGGAAVALDRRRRKLA